MTPDVQRERRFNAAGIAGGLVVLILGVLMLLDRGGYADFHLMQYFPGAVLIVIGLSALTNTWARGRRRSFGGLWLVMIGAWMVISQAQLFGLNYGTTWPLLIIGVGIMIVLGALFPQPENSVKKDEDGR